MFYQYLGLFFVYSFLGWVLETVMAALYQRRFVNIGLAAGPFLFRYGLYAVLITLLGRELQHRWFFLFVGCSAIGGFLEWASGRILERITRKKWWDYSARRFHLDGYVSLASALIIGAAGVIWLILFNPFFLWLGGLLPPLLLHIVLWVLTVIFVFDAFWSLGIVLGLPQRFPRAEAFRNRLLAATLRLNYRVISRTRARLHKSYPGLKEEAAPKEKPGLFAQGLCFDKLFWLYFVGSFLGAMAEMVFCRVKAGYWMSRSSLVWGQFSVVWGLALVLATLLLYNYRHRSDMMIFAFGTILGGVYEYACSVFTELAFGQVFWDYSAMPFNLGGRINLLYCFFWGIAAVVWLKLVYPFMSRLIEKIPRKPGKALTAVLVVFMAVNMSVSVLALARSRSRTAGKPADNAVASWLDRHYGDEVMARIYPDAIMRDRPADEPNLSETAASEN